MTQSFTPVTSLRKAKDRKRFCEDVRKHVLAVEGVEEERSVHRGRELIFRFHHASLSCSLWLRPEETDPLISWFDAKRNLGPLWGVWESVNNFHHRKATSFPRSLDDTIRRLVEGFTAAGDGSAFND